MINGQKLDLMMMELGHTESVAGTSYLRRAVAMYDEGMTRMTKELYPAIAAAVDSTPSRVERCMRHSIQRAWGRGSFAAQCQYFGHTINPETGVPTVGEYVARMARLCRAAEGQE